MAQLQNLTVRIKWSGEDVEVQPANVFVLQGKKESLVLSLGYAAPPVETADLEGDELQKYLAKHPVHVQGVTRFWLHSKTVNEIAEALQRHIAASEGEEA